ncbi:MAG TPA: Ig-like domain-containing protein, partial [Anaerolineales bacterium]
MNSHLRWFALTGVLLFSLSLTACGGATPVPSLTPTHEKLSIQASPSAQLQITHQNPLPGERLGLSPTVEIMFDRPMLPDKTASAWQFVDADGKSVAGKITWSDPQTFHFQPDQSLKAGQTYTGIFSVSASGADGATLPQETRIDFQTTDELAVGQVFPADNARDVDNRTAITVIFNKPVIPLMTKEEQAKLPSPITIQPALDGSGSWVNTSVYVFQPETALKSGTDYTLSVHRGLKDVSGVALASDYAWKFTTRAPFVADFVLKNIMGVTDITSNVQLDQSFVLTFNQPMDQASVAEALLLVNIETKRESALKLSWDPKSTILTVTPTNLLTIASYYDLKIAASAKARDGGTLKESFTSKLSTVPFPAITETKPSEGKQTSYSPFASVSFNTQMKAESVKSRVKVLPEPKVPIKLFYREGQNQLDIYGFEPSTDYVVRILPGMTDIYGNSIKSEFSFRFQTPGLNPQARLVTPGYPLIYRQQSDQSVFFEYTNLETAKISLYRLSFNEFAALSGGTPEMDNLGEASGKLLREWSPSLLAGKDRFARVLLHLDEQGVLKPGYYYLGLNARPLNPQHRFWQGAIFIVSNDNLALKATQNEALAWMVDSASGEPVEGVPLNFYNDAWKMVGKGVTDKNGLAHLMDATNVQYVQAEDEKHLALAALNWGSGVSEGQFGIWTDYWSPIKNTFVYTYTERPLYRPNQPVYIKGIVRANDDLHYSLPEFSQVYLLIENEQGKIFGENVALSKNGTFTSEYQLSSDAPVGNYNISVKETAESDNVLSWSSFRVAEYVKPEFLVTSSVEPQIVLNGEEAKFSLDAAYYSGGALSNATVKWYIEQQPFFYTPTEAYNNYSFSDFDYYDYYSRGKGSTQGPQEVSENEGQTDTNGHFELSQKMELPKNGDSQQATFYANVTDVGGNLVGSNTSLTVLGSALHAGIRPENYVGVAGEKQTFNLVVLDVEGKPVAKQAVSVSFAEQRWFSVSRKDKNGVSIWETSVKSIPSGSANAVTDEKGLASVVFTPPAGGEFKAIVTARDEKGRPARAAAYLWVSSEAYIPWRQTNDRSFQLVADKSSYNPGDTAKILIAQPFEGENYALITIERGHIYEKKVIKLQTNSTLYELPITSEMAPVMYVSVMVVKGADGKNPPDFKMGLLRLNVNPARQSIFVSVQSDKTAASPGEKV